MTTETAQTDTDSPAPPPAAAPKPRKFIEPGRWSQHSLWEIIESVPDDYWTAGRVQGYVYRHEPTYTPTQKGDGSYILKFKEPIDQDDIKEKFGSGAYAARLVDRDGDQKKYEKFEIVDADYPPNLPNPEWREHSVNRRWIFSKADAAPAAAPAGDVFAQAEKLLQLMSKQGSAGPSDANLMADRFEKLTERIIDITAKQPDRTAEAFALLAKAKDLLPQAPAPVDDKITPMLLQLLMNREQQQPAAPPDPVAQMRAALELMRELKDEANPPPQNSEGPVWLGPVIQSGAALIGAIVAKLTAGGPTPQQQPHQPPQHAQQLAAGQQQPPQQPQPDAQAQPEDPSLMLLRQVINAVAQPIITHLSDPETTGADFCDFMLRGYPPDLVAQCQAQPAEAWVSEIMRSELWAVLQQANVDEARLRKFVDEFREFKGDE